MFSFLISTPLLSSTVRNFVQAFKVTPAFGAWPCTYANCTPPNTLYSHFCSLQVRLLLYYQCNRFAKPSHRHDESFISDHKRKSMTCFFVWEDKREEGGALFLIVHNLCLVFFLAHCRNRQTPSGSSPEPNCGCLTSRTAVQCPSLSTSYPLPSHLSTFFDGASRSSFREQSSPRTKLWRQCG